MPEWSEEGLLRTYSKLAEVEAAFRIHKNDPSIRPIWHQQAERLRVPPHVA